MALDYPPAAETALFASASLTDYPNKLFAMPRKMLFSDAGKSRFRTHENSALHASPPLPVVGGSPPVSGCLGPALCVWSLRL